MESKNYKIDNPQKRGNEATKNLTMFGFFAITASMVMAVYEYPTFATSGFSLVFFLIVGGLLWFIPVALCAAEMATVEGWQEGGIFTWVGKSLGERWGFAAISFQWLQITAGFVPMIYFLIGSLSYVLGWTELNSNPIIKTVAALLIVWGLAFSQFGGTKYTSRIARIGFVGGILVPAILLISLGLTHIISGGATNITMNTSTFFPDFTKMNTLVIFVSFILSYMGVEASAPHANELKNPNRDYPLAMFILVAVAITMSTAGGLIIAEVVPAGNLSLNSGIIQTFASLMQTYGTGFEWIVRIFALLLTLGIMAEISAWIVGPTAGMYVAAQKGLLPKVFSKVNKAGVPVPLVLAQMTIVSIFIIVLTLGGGGSNMSFLLAMGLTVVIYLVSYFLLFLSYMVLALKGKDKKRAYQIPGGTPVKMIVAIIGFSVSVFAFIISFVAPAGLSASESQTYVLLLVILFLIILSLPFILYAVHGKNAKKAKNKTYERVTHENVHSSHFFVHPKARPSHVIDNNKNKTKE